VNAGDGVSYQEFARAALNTGGYEGIEVEPIDGDALNRPAPRPRNSRLKCLLSEAVGLPAMPFWGAALEEFVGSHYQTQKPSGL